MGRGKGGAQDHGAVIGALLNDHVAAPGALVTRKPANSVAQAARRSLAVACGGMLRLAAPQAGEVGRHDVGKALLEAVRGAGQRSSSPTMNAVCHWRWTQSYPRTRRRPPAPTPDPSRERQITDRRKRIPASVRPAANVTQLSCQLNVAVIKNVSGA